MAHRKFNKLCRFFSSRFFLGIFYLLLVAIFSTTAVYAAYERFAPGTTATIGEFVYEDDFSPSTEDCVANIYDPSGGAVVTNAAMSEAASGWHWYDYSIPAVGPEGIWPASMSCGTGGELVKVDKTFSVGAVIVSSSTISSAVWASSTRTLTEATINGGSLATTDELNSNDNILYDTINNASSSLFATLPGSIWSYSSRALTTFGTLADDVWSASGRTLSSFGTLVADVWTNGTRTLTGAGITSVSIATLSDVTTATSSLGAAITNSQTAINNNTNTVVATASSSLLAVLPASVWGYSSRTLSSFGTLAADVWNSTTRTLTSLTLSSQSPWTVSTSDFGSITAGSDYLATVTTIYNGTLTDSLSVPTVTIYDPSRNVIANNVAMTRVATGTYSYSYTTDGSAPAGTWESVFSANVETGKTLPGNDYWTVVTAPAQVIINSISDSVTPEVAANVTITNEGLTGYEYQYEWCVVSNSSDTCGGGDDIFHGVAAKYINAGEDFNTTLTADVPTAGNYYFKMIVYFGTDSSGASRSFTATAPTSGGGGSGGGGGGGGGGGSSSGSGTTVTTGACTGADFNRDSKVNSVDFSILLSFWKKRAPFRNVCVDINRDSIVNSVDFSILLSQWGTAGRAI